jgi:hypothetical protein
MFGRRKETETGEMIKLGMEWNGLRVVAEIGKQEVYICPRLAS